MSILLTGGTGKTATALVPYLESSKTPYLLTSRSTSTSPNTVQFDFTVPSTYSNPFDLANNNGSPIKAIYLVLPMQAPNAVEVTKNFIDFALNEHDVKRFVLLGATNVVKGGPGPHAGVWDYLSALNEEGKVEATILRCTWFLGMCSSSKVVRGRRTCK
jgi:nucleoside-diphosphate-sugar epimerase